MINFLDERVLKYPPAQYITQAVEPCLRCNFKFYFNNINKCKTDGTAQKPHMSCLNPDIAMTGNDNKFLGCKLPPNYEKTQG